MTLYQARKAILKLYLKQLVERIEEDHFTIQELYKIGDVLEDHLKLANTRKDKRPKGRKPNVHPC